MAITKKIDNLGRIVIPNEFRKSLGIELDQEIKMDLIDNKIVISNINGMRSYEEIKQAYRDIRNMKVKTEYDEGFEQALKFILNK